MRACDVCESKDGVVAYCVEGAREGAAKGERRLQPTATFLDLCPEHAKLATAETLLGAIKGVPKPKPAFVFTATKHDLHELRIDIEKKLRATSADQGWHRIIAWRHTIDVILDRIENWENESQV